MNIHYHIEMLRSQYWAEHEKLTIVEHVLFTYPFKTYHAHQHYQHTMEELHIKLDSLSRQILSLERRLNQSFEFSSYAQSVGPSKPPGLEEGPVYYNIWNGPRILSGAVSQDEGQRDINGNLIASAQLPPNISSFAEPIDTPSQLKMGPITLENVPIESVPFIPPSVGSFINANSPATSSNASSVSRSSSDISALSCTKTSKVSRVSKTVSEECQQQSDDNNQEEHIESERPAKIQFIQQIASGPVKNICQTTTKKTAHLKKPSLIRLLGIGSKKKIAQQNKQQRNGTKTGIGYLNYFFKPFKALGIKRCRQCNVLLPFWGKRYLKCDCCQSRQEVEEQEQLRQDIISDVPSQSSANSNQEKSLSKASNIVEAEKHKTPFVYRRAPKGIGLDDFEFIRILGIGGFGKVFLTKERRTGANLALKVLRKDFLIENQGVESAFVERNVLKLLSSKQNRFLVNFHSCFQTERRLYFVMEYVPGGDLDSHLLQQERFTEPIAKFFASELLLALEFLHRNNIMHRDLKPTNILLTADGHIKLADFGLSRENMSNDNRAYSVCGTYEYMAPEVISGKPYGKAAEFWSYGILFYKMLVGSSPFQAGDWDEIEDRVLNQEISYPPYLSLEVVQLLQSLLVRNPQKRLGYTSIYDVIRHRYFDDVKWGKLNVKEVQSPYTMSDLNVDPEAEEETPLLTPCPSVLPVSQQREFQGFTYLTEWAKGSEGPEYILLLKMIS